MLNTDTAMQILHRALFGKESCVLFVGLKVSGAVLQLSTETSLEAALWSAIPWLGALSADVVWYAAPVLLKKVAGMISFSEVPVHCFAQSVMTWLRLRFLST